MNPKIRVKRGKKINLPTFDEGEIGFTTDTKQFYVGSDAGNQELAKISDVAGSIGALQAQVDGSVGALQTKVNSIDTSIASLQSHVDEVDASIVEIISSIGATVPPDTTAPTPPAVSLSNLTDTAVTLSWTASTDNVGVAGYDVYQGVTKLATVSGLQYTVTGLTASTEYTFQVYAKDAAGNISTVSNIITTTTNATVTPPTPDPSALTVNLTETTEAFASPLMGFRPSRNVNDSSFKAHEYATIFKHYIKYTDLEVDATDLSQKIKDWSNGAAWANIQNRNLKVVPRVVIVQPGSGEYWPNGISHTTVAEAWQPNNTNTINRLVAMIAKMADAWDNDPRVGFVELGLYGKWGEHHIYPDTLSDGKTNIPLSFQTAMGNAAKAAFKNKKVTIRYADSFTAFDFGFYWDSFALPNDAVTGNGEITKNNWRTQINSGEVAYNWGDQSKLGGSPDANLSIPVNVNNVVDWIMKTHTSSLGWIADYSQTNSAVLAGAAVMQKVLGYRFVLSQVTFTSNVTSGGSGIMNVSFKVTNKGSSPFYYDWPVEACLLDSGGAVAWKGIFKTDIRTWLPGDSWNIAAAKYDTPPAVNTVAGAFTIPGTVANGTYTLTLSIIDPFGWAPSVRFANTNYYAGGRTPIGKVGIGGAPANQTLNTFAGLKADTTLTYSLTSSAYTGSIAGGGTVPTDTIPPVVSISPAAGTYTTAQSVTLWADETATIYYTTDGSAPTTTSAVYSSPIPVGLTTTVRYFGRDTAGNESAVQSAVFTINAPPLFEATFNQANSNTTLGAGWTVVGGGPFGIDNNEAYSVSDADGGIVYANTGGATNYAVTQVSKGCIATGPDSRRFNLICRYIDSNNFIMVSVVGGSMTLSKFETGITGVQPMGSYVAQTTANDVYLTIRAVCNGSNIKVYVNNILKIDYTMTTAEVTKFSGSTKVGWRHNKTGQPGTIARVDNYSVTSL